METKSKEYRQTCDQKGAEYEDFICQELHKRGIVIQNMRSKKYQYKTENLLGLEIKLNSKATEYGSLYIETHEKAMPRKGDYALSGINRNDGNWLFGTGDYNVFFIFAKNTLKRLLKNNPEWLGHPKPSSTSQGFCIPIDKAHGIAAKIIYFNKAHRDVIQNTKNSNKGISKWLKDGC